MPIVTTSNTRKRANSTSGSTGNSSGSAPATHTHNRRKSTSKASHKKTLSGHDLKTIHSNGRSSSPSSASSNSSPSHVKKGSKKHGKEGQSLWSSFLHFYQTKKFIFILGALIGLFAAGYSVRNNDLVNLEMLNDLNLDSISDFMEDWKTILPSGIMKEAQQFDKPSKDLSEPFKIGLTLRNEENITAKNPVIMVPGVISTGLESWSMEGTPECPAKPFFRKRLWGSWYMLRAMLLSKDCWLKNLMLDPVTGLDPPHFKMRAAQGMEAADFFVAGYWIWNRILENLAAIGYDPLTMSVAAYDWRLSYPDLEKRDGYFTQLKLAIEHNYISTGKKTVLISHSMGSQVVFYFMKWVEAKGYGNAGKGWVNKHIASFVDISGSMLGTPKAIVALLSGEMKDTVQLNAMAVYGLEKFFSRRERADLLRSFGGIASMLPKGGAVIWGDQSQAPDDYSNQNTTFGNFIRFREPKSDLSNRNLTVQDSIEYLLDQGTEDFKRRINSAYTYGIAYTEKEIKANDNDPRKWTNPLEVALPDAPDMDIYCLYGVGKPTERSYYYKEEENKTSTNLNVSIAIEQPDAVVLGEGDGTISLVTHSMCYKWKEENSRYNPGKIPIKIVEMSHEPDSFDIRGGAKTAEHVDILGRAELNEMVLRIVSGHGNEIKEKHISPLGTWVKGMDF